MPTLELVINASKARAGAVEMRAAGETIAAAAGRVDGAMRTVDKSVDRAGQAASRAMTWIKGILATFAAFETAKRSLSIAGEMEANAMAFETLLGSAEKAKQTLADLNRFAATTPFELPGVLSTSKQLLAMGFEAERLLPIMRSVGDATAALGGGDALMQRIVLALGQMQNKGQLATQEMRQLAEAGIPAWDLLAKKLGTDIPEAMRLVEQGAVSGAGAVDAMLEGFQSKYANATQKLSQTMPGLWSTFVDSARMGLGRIGEELVRAFDLKDALKWAIGSVDELASQAARGIRILSELAHGIAENEKLMQTLATAAKVALGVFVVFETMQAFDAVKTGIMGAVSAMQLLTASAWPVLAVLSAIAAFELGRYFYDEFRVVRETALEVAGGILKGWEHMKYYFEVVVAGIRNTWAAAMRFMGDMLTWLMKKMADSLKQISPIAELLNVNTTTAGELLGGFAGSYQDELYKRTQPVKPPSYQDYQKNLAAIDQGLNDEFKDLQGQFDANGRRTGRSFWQFAADDASTAVKTIAQAISNTVGEWDVLSGAITRATIVMGKSSDAFKESETDIGAWRNAMQEFNQTAHAPAPLLADITEEAKKVNQAVAEMIGKLDLERQYIGMSSSEKERALKVEELRLKAYDAEGKAIRGVIDRTAEYRDKLRMRDEAEYWHKANAEIGQELELITKSSDEAERLRATWDMQAHGIDTASEAARRYMEQLDRLQDLRRLRQIAEGIGDAFGKAFEDIIMGAQSVSEAMKNLAVDIERVLVRKLVTEQIASAITSGVMKFGTSLGGGGKGTGGPISGTPSEVPTPVGSGGPTAVTAMGGIFAYGSLIPFAAGGVVSRPTTFGMSGGRYGLMGEAGPEAVMPLARDSQGRLGVRGGVTVNQTFNISTPNADSFRRSQKQLATAMQVAVSRASRG